MFSYYGSKKSIVNYYPAPRFNKIIEPFAGTAPYALKYFDRDVLLVDKYEVIIKIWQWLQKCSPNDVLKLPRPKDPNDNLDNYTFDCEEAKLLMGFAIAKGGERPRTKPTERATINRPNTVNFTLNKIAKNLFKIKHWEIKLGSYEDILNEKVTWFIDPPYQFGGDTYVESGKNINFNDLSEWCRSREGQSIVCENTRANWMDFKPMIKNKGTHITRTEAIWTNLPTSYGMQQTSLF